MDKRINDYITAATKAGVPDSEIRHGLLDAGWNREEVAEALARQKKHTLKNTRRWLAAGALLLIAGGIIGLWPYAKAYVFPDQFWRKYLANPFPFSFSANVKLAIREQSGESSFLLEGPIQISPGRAKGAFTITSGEKNNPTKSEIDVVASGHSLYLNARDNAGITNLLREIRPNATTTWMNINFDSLGAKLAEESGGINRGYGDFSSALKAVRPRVIASSGALSIGKPAGFEVIDGARCVNANISVDKQKLKNALLLENELAMREKKAGDEEKDRVASEITYFIDRLDIKSFKTCLGIFDGKLHRLSLETSLQNGPSIQLDSTLNSYGAPVNIAPPPDSIDMIGELFIIFQKSLK